MPVGSNEPISTRQIGGKTRYQAKRVAEIGGDAAVAFAEGCSFPTRESETRDWAVGGYELGWGQASFRWGQSKVRAAVFD